MLPLFIANGNEPSRYDAMVATFSALIENSPLDPSGCSENCPDQTSCSPASVAALNW